VNLFRRNVLRLSLISTSFNEQGGGCASCRRVGK